MFNKDKQIIFQPSTEKSELLIECPTPSYKSIPEWYKKQKLFSNGENDYFKAFKKSTIIKTFKLCTPLVDSMTAGYMITLPADIIITNASDSGYTPIVNWTVSWEVLDVQSTDVLGSYPVPEGFYPQLFRWHPKWIIKTPSKYSLWITHPSHRNDLPFLTINSFVDTDKHPNALLFPFFIKKGFEGVIEKGTPIVQIIPVKRDSWTTKIKKFSKYIAIVGDDNVALKFIRFYKHTYWTRKKYE
jgi:hypothetical protein